MEDFTVLPAQQAAIGFSVICLIFTFQCLRTFHERVRFRFYVITISVNAPIFWWELVQLLAYVTNIIV